MDALVPEILSAFEFASARGDEEIAVRAFNPRLDRDGYEAFGSVVETNTRDLPFLVDSVTAELQSWNVGIGRVLHPIIGTDRDAEGRIVGVVPAREALNRESVIHFELDRHLDDDLLVDLAAAIHGVLSDVLKVVADFPEMIERVGQMEELADASTARYGGEEIEEAALFLRWLRQGNFVFLGYREYEVADGRVQVVPDSGLGLLRDEGASAYARPVLLDQMPESLRERVIDGDLLIVSKTNRLAPVHRRARMDYVGVRRIDAEGHVVGEARMLGLLTTQAYSERASRIPVLRRKLARILREEDLFEGSHDYKAAVAAFESFPKDELFDADTEDLRRAVVSLLALGHQRIRLLARRGHDERSVSLIAALPRARYTPTLLLRLRDLLRRRFDSHAVDHHLVLGEADRVQIHFTVHRPAGGIPDVSFKELEREVVDLTRSWDDLLAEELEARHGLDAGKRLADRWAHRFPDYYKTSMSIGLAADDVESFERLEQCGEQFVISLQDDRDEHGHLTRIALAIR